MTKQEKILKAQELLSQNWSQRKIAIELEVHPTTIAYWILKKFQVKTPIQISFLNQEIQKAYSYLLSLYLGDGYIKKTARTYRFMISQDGKYPDLIKRHVLEINTLLPTNLVNVGGVKNSNVKNVYVYSNLLPSLFPQHGSGVKYERKIKLTEWQLEIRNKYPWQFLEGFIHSDGSIYMDIK